MSDQQPPYGEAGSTQPPEPAEPPPYGQSGASWPNSQPAPPPPSSKQLPPTHSIPGHGPPPASAAGLPYGSGQHPPMTTGPQGSHPYGGQGGYGGPYIPPLPQQSSTGKIVAIVIGVILLLTCGGCAVFGVAIYNAGQDVLDEIEAYDPPSVDEVVVVAPGEPFLVGDFSVSGGWEVSRAKGIVGVEGMTVRKVGDTAFDTAAFEMTFFRGDRELGQATCSGTVSGSDTESAVTCMVTDKLARRADRVEVRSLI